MSPVSEFGTFGGWLKRRRKLLDLTQDQLGRLAGCSGAAIRKFEADERKPSRQLAELLAIALQIPDAERDAFLSLARGIRPATLPGNLPAISDQQPDGLSAKDLPAENLPAPLTSLVDRVNDLAEVSTMLSDSSVRWVTLIGPPGIGKTRLSIQVGRQVLAGFPDGVWFVDLAPLDDSRHVLPAVSRALVDFELPPAASLEQIAIALKSRNALLILDNFEHVTDAAVEVAELLKRCAHLKVLATSRIPLHIYGEYEYRVPPLSIPPRKAAQTPQRLMDYESVQLFAVRARQHQPSFAVNPETAAAIVEIVNTLDGIPLALELAAATLRRMTLNELDGLLHHLDGESWLRQMGTPARDLPARQRTLENVVAWSYTLLKEDQQDLFNKLAIFSGWFDLDAVLSICYKEPRPRRTEVRGLLDGLTDHNLLVRDNLGSMPCWRMLEIIREYAGLQLSLLQRAELESLRAQYYLTRLRSMETEPDGIMRENFFLLNINNLLASLKWAIAEQRTELGFQLAMFVEEFGTSHGYHKEVLDFMKQLFDLPDQDLPEVRATRLELAADMAWQQHDFESGLAFTKEEAELRRVHGLPDKYAIDLNRMGRIYLERGNFAEARQVLSECLALARADPKHLNPGVPLAQLGELSLFEGNLKEAKAFLNEALEYLDESEAIFLAITKVDLAELALAEQDFRRAREWLEQGYPYARLHLRRAMVYLCAVAGYLLLVPRGDKDAAKQAARLYGAIQSLEERSGVLLSPYYHKLNRQRAQLAFQRLTEDEWKAESETGQQWSVESALAQAIIAIRR
jgi:predicted ATPase/DNA-binding XRE family transcriptional regulator